MTGLILAGGGARGAYQVGVLKGVAEFFSPGQNPFPVISGVSVGAINAVAIASQLEDFIEGVARLERLWINLHSSKIFKDGFWTITFSGLHWLAALTLGGLGVSNPKSLFDTRPLRELLTRSIDFSAISRAVDKGILKAIGVTASSYACGRAITFFEGEKHLKEWKRGRREGVRERLTVDHIMCSTALPLIFPAQQLGHDYYGDGSMRLISPLSPAIHLGADRILVIGTRDELPDPTPDQTNVSEYPDLGKIGGYALDILFNENLGEDIDRANRINHTISLLPPAEAEKTPLRTIEILTIRPSQDIREIARKHAHQLPWVIRMLLKSTGSWGGNWQLPSYLLFEPRFCRDLIELGYQDTLARKQQICNFLERRS
ncbi:MAG: patatin-like phospholipase family protein [Acidobacteriota bacterium]